MFHDTMFNHNTLEKDIERLSREVSEKRELPEHKGSSEREIIKQTIQPLVRQRADESQSGVQQTSDEDSVLPDYLRQSSPESRLEVEKLIDAVFHEGLGKTVKVARAAGPFILDAFHDALTDKLYDELKKRKL